MEGAWHRIEAWGKAHPVMLGVLVFVIGAIILWLLIPRSGGAAAQAGPSDAYYNAQAAMAASGNQLAAAQLAAQAHANDTQAQLTATQTQVAGAATIAGIQAQQATDIATIQANYLTAHDKTVAASTDLASTLTAQVQGAGIAAQAHIADINASAATDAARIAATTQLGLASYQAQTAEAGYQAQLGAFSKLLDTQQTVAGYQAQTQQTLATIAGYTQDVNILANAQVAAAAIGRG
jgi:hypothetical protein